MSEFELSLVKELPEDLMRPRVKATVAVEGDQLVVRYEVTHSKLNARTGHSKTEPVWGLWDTDVCEIFVSSAQEDTQVAEAPYYEFQVSPFGQYFEMQILEPRKQIDKTYRSGIKVTGEVKTVRAWTASMSIPLSAMKLDPAKPIYGGVFACLLREPHRAYLAINHPLGEVADFHKPNLFVKLV